MSELVDRLAAVLDERQAAIQVQDDYYTGVRPTLVLPDRTLPSYKAIVEQAKSPWGELVIDAAAERMKITGYRVITPDQGDDTDVEADSLCWDIWQASRGDTWAPAGFSTMLRNGVSYLLVEQGSNGLPALSFEPPSTVATMSAPGGRATVAGLKRWSDGQTDVVVLWTADTAETWVRDRSRSGMKWELTSDQRVTNTTGIVPIFALKNRPDLLGGYSSDLDSLYSTIDRATQSLADRITVQFFSSTRIRVLIGVEPEFDENGNPASSTLKLATDKLLLIENENAKVASLDASDLRQFIETSKSDISSLAAIARLPSYLLSGDMVNVSAEALQSLMQGLVSRVEQRQTWASAALSDGMRLALKLAGDPRVDDPRCRVEPIWADIVEPDLASSATAAAGLVSAGIMSATGAQDVILGLTPSEREKLAQYTRADALTQQGAQVIAGLFQTPTAPEEPAEPEEAAVA